MKEILAPISLGELVDKITILELKVQALKGEALMRADKELHLLLGILETLKIKFNPDDSLINRLREINRNLWEIEDLIREKENASSFGDEFIRLARSVYLENDKRAELKRIINYKYGSILSEEKIYPAYQSKEIR